MNHFEFSEKTLQSLDALQLESDPIWVDSDTVLAELCERWAQQAAIAVDTEFMRSHTFYPHAGLIQVGDGRGCYLIDPLAINDFAPFTALMINDKVTKILHSSSEDLEVFRFLLGVIPTPLFDTQVAAAFAGHGFSLGYAGLVKASLAIELSKGETRSDWMQRPLSQSQLHYAALDVAYMPVIYGKLVQALRKQGRLDWVRGDCAELVQQAENKTEGDDTWLKFKSAWKLNKKELAVLRALSDWREAMARERDIPRNRVMKEGALIELAQRKPQKHHQLSRFEGLPPRTLRSDGETILELIDIAINSDETQFPEVLAPPLPPQQAERLKACKKLVREIAEAEGLPPEVLLRKKDYEEFVRSGMSGHWCLPERLQGWRVSLMGEPLLALAQSF